MRSVGYGGWRRASRLAKTANRYSLSRLRRFHGHISQRHQLSGRAGRQNAHQFAGRIQGDDFRTLRLRTIARPRDGQSMTKPRHLVGRKMHARQILDRPQRRLQKPRQVVAVQLARIDGLLRAGNGRSTMRTSADITAAVPSDSARSRPSERMYVPLPHATSKTNSGYRYATTSMRWISTGRAASSGCSPLSGKLVGAAARDLQRRERRRTLLDSADEPPGRRHDLLPASESGHPATRSRRPRRLRSGFAGPAGTCPCIASAFAARSRSIAWRRRRTPPARRWPAGRACRRGPPWPAASAVARRSTACRDVISAGLFRFRIPQGSMR